MFRSTLFVCRSASTVGGQSSILKRYSPVYKYIKNAVDSGVYRTHDEIETIRRMAKSELAAAAARGTNVERELHEFIYEFNVERADEKFDYPDEYSILKSHPPIVKPKIPKKFRLKELKMPTERLLHNYLNRMPKPKQSSDDYYRELLNVEMPELNETELSQKAKQLREAYAFCIKQFEIMRTERVSEEEAMKMVDEMLAEEDDEERKKSREITETIRVWREKQQQQGSAATPPKPKPAAASRDAVGGDDDEDDDSPKEKPWEAWWEEPSEDEEVSQQQQWVPSILFGKPRTIAGMTRWSLRLQTVPYRQWTIGASTALDHWIAKNVLEWSDNTWDDVLYGYYQHNKKSRARDLIMARHALFPETIPSDDEDRDLDADDVDDYQMKDQDEDEIRDDDQKLAELLASLRRLDSKPADSQDDMDAADTAQKEPKDLDERIDKLMDEVQDWRAKHMERPYDQWSEDDKQQFDTWLNDYVSTVAMDPNEVSFVDLEETRKALLEDIPPRSRDESNAFWDRLKDETMAEVLLEELLKQGPPDNKEDAHFVLFAAFWELPYAQQLERLMNLGALRPILDEFFAEGGRRAFLARHGEALLEGVELEHLIPDPVNGNIPASELGPWVSSSMGGVSPTDRFRLVKIPYGSVDGVEDAFSNPNDAERARALFRAWNAYKAGRAQYEERMFQRGKLGLVYPQKKK